MAPRKNTRRVARRVGRELSKKKNRGLLVALVIMVVIVLVIATVVGFILYKKGLLDEFLKPNGGTTPPSPDEPYVETLKGNADGEIDIHFIELGNKYTGDCTYIQVGNIDVLIDAGSRTSSISAISAYLDAHMKDDVLDYVIVTHAHQDHYAGFATSEKTESLFDIYNVGTIIDFACITDQKADTAMYKNYIRERDAEIAAGAKHYTAKECIDQDKNVFALSDDVSMTILDQKYYHEKSSNENDHSVCTLFSQGDAHYLFTGDLEEEGEESLVQLNELPEVVLYKAGHHGSKTSSSNELLNVIKPHVVTVCCCAGSSEYTNTNENQFPTQQFVDRISPYTQLVYVTTLCLDYKADKAEEQYTSMNGNIHISVKDGVMTITCSDSGRILKEWDWFKNNRVMPNSWK